MRNWVAGFLVAAVFGFSAARADEVTYTPTTLTAQQVLAKAQAARGGTADGTYHWVVTGTGANGDTWQSESYRSGDDYVEHMHDDGYDSASGSYQGTSWEQDENGGVMVDSNFHESENPFTNAVTSVEKSAAPDVRVLGITSDSPTSIVLELKPKDGLRQLRYYDPSTYLLQKVETTGYDGLAYAFTYSDYQTRNGLTYAGHIAYSDTHPENAWSDNVQTFERVAANQALFAIPQSRPTFDLAGRNSVQIPADFTDEGIIVRVNIAGRGLDLQLDSGASDIVLDSDVAKQLGLHVDDVRKSDFGGDFSEGRARVPDMALGDLHAHNLVITSIQFSRQLGDRKVVGLLGGSFFSSARIGVDFTHQTLTMLSAAQAAPADPWIAIPIDVDDLVPRVKANFNNVDGSFVVDLGADDTMLYPHFFHQFTPKGSGGVLGQVEGVAGQAVDYKKYVFSRFGMGSLEFADASVMVPQGSTFEDLDYDGLIGRNILSNFNLIFDYAARKLYIQSMVSN